MPGVFLMSGNRMTVRVVLIQPFTNLDVRVVVTVELAVKIVVNFLSQRPENRVGGIPRHPVPGQPFQIGVVMLNRLHFVRKEELRVGVHQPLLSNIRKVLVHFLEPLDVAGRNAV